MSTGSEPPREPTEEELRAAYEAQIKQVRVEHVVLEHVVTIANLGLRRTGLAPGTEDERDPEQVRVAIDSIRALLPVLDATMPEQAAQIKDALSQLQFAFVKIGGAGPAGTGAAAEPAPPPEAAASEQPPPGQPAEQPQADQPQGEQPQGEQASPEEPGPAQRSGRLWVPGQ
ncbi:MAG TPA: hypothetical protein VGF81_06525 [Solirubrobacteraceae bacterium]|jgi:hypothetical protein